ncbi:hypothetical protein CCH79_00008254 [Gambusia affinis]|uniref:Uncharacterized protein n=1 Tax=Gambusia affinis TaxID=33528 RepID=A0A315V6L9_GAMAF|nr:hypothetical protein CCH79_00008254 [Gambusia affinis]
MVQTYSPTLFRNTNVEEVLNRQKQKRDQAREDAQKKKEVDKMQREKDKLAKQDRKEKEKKRTQKACFGGRTTGLFGASWL